MRSWFAVALLKRQPQLNWLYIIANVVNVATDIGRKFLQPVDECFTANRCLPKIFNRNTLKLNYSCMPNVHQIITALNKTVLNKQTNPLKIRLKSAIAARKNLALSVKMANRKRCIPGHSNPKRQPT